MRIAFAQFNSELGNIDYNFEQILSYVERAIDKRAELIVFQELALLGYMPQDLLDRSALIKYQLKKLAEINKKIPKGVTLVVGCVRFLKGNREYCNSAAILEKGKKPRFADKTLLPNYDVFDEARYYNSGSPEKNIITVKGKKILITICEDLWIFDKKTSTKYENPYKKVKSKKINIVVNISASPFTKEKIKDRLRLAKEAAAYFKSSVIYVNQVGAQDELIFDGKSFAMDSKGKVLTQSLAFQEDINMVDFSKNESGKRHTEKEVALEDIRQALVLGIRDYVKKNGFTKVHLGISGGIDSAVVACLAADAVGPSNVHTIAMPTQFNANESYDLAKELSTNLGVGFQNFPIENIFQSLKSEIDTKYNINEFALVHENLQSRIRGLLLMAYSNSTGSMLLTTGNKSEFAMGYSTLYGDMCGGLAPIGDLLKSEVFALARLYNKSETLIPNRIIDRAPSAELRPNQKDQDSLPAYEKLDPLVEKIIVHNCIVRTDEEKWALNKIFKSEFKRRQAPPILKISSRAFGVGRRYPISHKSELL